MKLTDKIIEKLHLNIYKLNEVETFNYICDLLDEKMIPYETHNKNIYSITRFGAPCFCAHLDTVCDADMKKDLFYDSNKGLLSRSNGILGADDKAGVAIILSYVEECNFAFFHSEEIGGIGSYEMSTHENFLDVLKEFEVPCFVQYDRRGRSDMIAEENQYCCTDLSKHISELTHYNSARGVFTDIDNLCDILPGVNLSCGYYNGHSKHEYLSINDYLLAHSTLPKLNAGLNGTYKIPEPMPVYWSNYNGIGSFANPQYEFVFDDDNDIEYNLEEFTDDEITYLTDCLFISPEDINKFGRQYFLDMDLLEDTSENNTYDYWNSNLY